MKTLKIFRVLDKDVSQDNFISKLAQKLIMGGYGDEWECVSDNCKGTYDGGPGSASYFMNCGNDCDRECQHCLECGVPEGVSSCEQYCGLC